MTIRTLRLLPLLLLCPSLAHAAAWINEIHYDNAGTDVGERIEIAGDADEFADGFAGRHTHQHEDRPLAHSHPHVPDLHHRHGH